MTGELTVNFFVGLVHGVEFLVGFLQALQLVRRVDKDAVGLVGVHMDVDVLGWDCLVADRGSVTEEGDVGERDRHVFLRHIEV